MTRWSDDAVILTSNEYCESFFIVTFLSQNHGIYSGLIRKSQAKNKNHPGNSVRVNWSGKNDKQLGYITFEIIKSYYTGFIYDRTKLYILNSCIAMINKNFAQHNIENFLFVKLQEMLEFISKNDDKKTIIQKYIKFEIEVLSITGYGLSLNRCAVSGVVNLHYISPKTGHAVSEEVGKKYHDKLFKIPAFFLSEIAANYDEIRDGFSITGYFIRKNMYNDIDNSFFYYREQILNSIK